MKLFMAVTFTIVFGFLSYRDSGLWVSISVGWFWFSLYIVETLREKDKERINSLRRRIEQLENN